MPQEFRSMCQGVVIRIEDLAPDDVLQSLGIESPFDLMGLYQGVSLNRKSVMDSSGPCRVVMPTGASRSDSTARPELLVVRQHDHAVGLSQQLEVLDVRPERVDRLTRAAFGVECMHALLQFVGQPVGV